ncbi:MULTISPECIES: TIGR02450 family Trp-rich protein [unclassified Undibacterium]|uniref:TIGR02450 family Trp-rich protein n=1 Tax=unclassified Undibacterium TaxID=2630295 RepID=UPI002AC958DA|nr:MULTISPECIES: TIGR02450 family Trp-rich protein [unclassified Undibacterium]MEB0139905.1 TIGR02450 family Trp-rich protein [Undibacterium sp. CCC2.1]MEB0171826.1 TIGR02450 family Trp-rich protein [Undibacterium sp. CCC1.1]MEB0175642.1 TIGR02450 family Trp-rich protein [Undibacterium sp. CCC3.4]MEB0216224.1 TIGR02450 family Trp-rich protein [Undibacterium sp. 5I2]WPX44117.1 TIGR02450 family Trp-rich protein [Undibacterium sp. CCC3.4]
MHATQVKKMLQSKWTALDIVAKQKHFLVTRLITPDAPNTPDAPIEQLEIEAVYSGARRIVPWQSLLDETQWRRGWL